MELPIRIIVTLFVAVVIAIAVISFAGKMISNSKNKLYSLSDEEVSEDKIIEVDSISSSKLSALADQCYAANSAKSIESVTCYVIFGDINADERSIVRSSGLNDSCLKVDLSGAHNAVRIKYDVVGDYVSITS